MIHIMLKRQSPSFQMRKDHLHHLHHLPSSSTATPTCDAAVKKSKPRKADKKPGTWEKLQDPQLPKPTTFRKADGFNRIWWTKCLVNPSIKYRNTAASKPKFMHVFDAEVDIICDFNSPTSIRVSEIQRPFATCVLTAWRMDSQWRITFCLVIEGCNIVHTSPIHFLKYIKGYIITTATSPLPKTYEQKRRKKKLHFEGTSSAKITKLIFQKWTRLHHSPTYLFPLTPLVHQQSFSRLQTPPTGLKAWRNCASESRLRPGWWWVLSPPEKYAPQNGFIFPNFRGENKKNI